MKELLSNPVILSNGYGVQWESIGGNNGVIKTDNEDLARMLKDLQEARRGGVGEITEEEYEALKKKPEPSSPRRLKMSEPWYPPVQLAGIQSQGVPVAGTFNPAAPAVPPQPAQQAQHIKPPLSVAGIDPMANRPKAGKPPTPKTPPPSP